MGGRSRKRERTWDMKTVTWLCVAAMMLFSAAVNAQQIDEVRIGAQWAQPDWLDSSHPEDHQHGIGAEVLFAPVNIDFFGFAEGKSSDFVRIMFNPRPHIGGLINLDKDGTSYAVGGLTWHYAIDDVFFVETGFGMGVHDGVTKSKKGRANLGSRVLFHERFGFGVNLTDKMTATLAVEHLSHARMFDDHNRGLSSVSLRVGQKF